MLQVGNDRQIADEGLGHSTHVTERTYARHSPSFMKDAAAPLEF